MYAEGEIEQEIFSMELVILSDSYSVVGTKTCTLGDAHWKAFQFTDTGGFLGEKVNHVLNAGQFLSKLHPLIVSGGKGNAASEVFGRVSLSDGYVVFSSYSAKAFLNNLLNLFPNEQCPRTFFSASISKVEANRYADFLKQKNEKDCVDWVAPDEIIWRDLTDHFMIPIGILFVDANIRISTPYGEDTEISAKSLQWTVLENTISCVNRVIIDGVEINGFEFSLPSADLALAYATKLGLDQSDQAKSDDSRQSPPDTALTSQVLVDGVLCGESVLHLDCSASLSADALTLLPSDSSRNPIRFDFKDLSLAIDGTSESFLISNQNQTVLRVSAKDTAFHRAIFVNQFVRSIAHRSSNVGPFVACTSTGEPVRLQILEDQATFYKGGQSEVVSLDDVAPPKLVWRDGIASLEVDGKVLTCQLPMIEGISSALLWSTLVPKVRSDFSGYVGELVGLEGMFIAYNLLGQLAEVHLAVTATLGLTGFAESATLTSEYEKNTFLAFMVENSGMLARGFQTNANLLPVFVINRDQDVLKNAGISNTLNTRNLEQAYQRAFGVTGPLAAHLYKIEAYVSRLASIRHALSQDQAMGKFIPLGISAAMSFVNPLALAGVAQQGYSLYSRSGVQSTAEQESNKDTFENCSKEWDNLVQNTLPYATYRVCQDVYPIRLTMSAILLGSYERADLNGKRIVCDAVTHRLSRLKTFLSFPSAFDKNIDRRRVVDFLFELQKNTPALGLRYF